MKKPLIYVLISILFLSAVFFLVQGFDFSVDTNDIKVQEVDEETSLYKYSGRVSEVGIDYLVMKIPIIPEEVDETFLDEDFEPELMRVTVYIPDDLEFVDVNDIQYVDVPEEYQGTLDALDYIIKLEDEEHGSYEVAVVVESENPLNVYDGPKKITATYVEWSCFPEGLF